MRSRNVIVGIALAVLIALGAGYFASKQMSSNKPSSQTVATTNQKPESNGATLDLSGQQLISLPESVLSQTNLTVLNVSNNQLTTLPAGIAKLFNLRVLNIENNRFESFPTEIAQLKNLRQIFANNNRMTKAPFQLETMTWLTLLDISGNNIPASEVNALKAQLPNTQIKS